MPRDPDDCVDFVADCRLRMATDLFTHVWDPVILAALTAGPQRRRTLRTGIGGQGSLVPSTSGMSARSCAAARAASATQSGN